MDDYEQLAGDYQRIERAIEFLEENLRRQPSLTEVASAAGLSEFHFQRLFGRWVGISPKRFLQFLTKEYARGLLERSRNLLDATYEAGLSGPSRLHDLFVSCEAVTPGQVRARGEGLAVSWGVHPSPFGRCLLAVTDRGICSLHFVQDEGQAAGWLQLAWPRARLRKAPELTAPYVQRVFPFRPGTVPAPLHLYVRGTNFQIQVWQALLRIPLGAAVSYEDLARHVGLPGAARAVGNAVGDNPIPFLIPCHRVIRKMGEFGNYGEGPLRKKAILGWEAALLASGQPEAAAAGV
jgi:AraC family transcriptional regulator of adaptative response/methylated-DNA-[protein]-cysteine methyltransferase